MLTHHCSVVYVQRTCIGCERICTHLMSRVQYKHFLLTVRLAGQLHDPPWHHYNARKANKTPDTLTSAMLPSATRAPPFYHVPQYSLKPFSPVGLQAAEASASWMHTAFAALTDSLNGQRQQLEAYAGHQQAASAAMLQHTHSAIAVARQHLHEVGGVSSACQQHVDQTLSAQSTALSAFDVGFANSMQEEQVC